MAGRIRTLKPEFWTDPDLVDLPFEARLWFIGLWTFADDYGVVAWEPRRLKVQIFPCDPVDPEAVTAQLVAVGCVQYATTPDGRPVLFLPHFKDHQVIDRRRTPAYCDPSELTPVDNQPAEPVDNQQNVDAASPDVNPAASQESPAPARNIPESSRRKGKEGKGKEGKGREEVQGQHPSRLPARDVPPDDGFDAFWAAYPSRDGRKVAKDKTRELWQRLTGDERTRAQAGAEHLAASGRLPKDPERFVRRDTAGAWPFDDWQTPAVADPRQTAQRARELFGSNAPGAVMGDVYRGMAAELRAAEDPGGAA